MRNQRKLLVVLNSRRCWLDARAADVPMKLVALLIACAVLQGCIGVVNVHLYDEMSMRAELDKRAKQGVVTNASTERH